MSASAPLCQTLSVLLTSLREENTVLLVILRVILAGSDRISSRAWKRNESNVQVTGMRRSRLRRINALRYERISLKDHLSQLSQALRNLDIKIKLYFPILIFIS